MPPTLGATLIGTLLGLACASSGRDWSPEPTPEFLAERPQRIAVRAPSDDGDPVGAHVYRELCSQVKEHGYELAEADADAVLRFEIGWTESGRNLAGIASADVAVSGELWGATGIVMWRGHATSRTFEDEDAFEDAEDNLGHGLDGFVVGTAVDHVFDAVLPPDYEEMTELAAEDAAQDMMWQFPERVDREAPPLQTAR